VRARVRRGDGLRKNDKKKAERKKTDITIRPAAVTAEGGGRERARGPRNVPRSG